MKNKKIIVGIIVVIIVGVTVFLIVPQFERRAKGDIQTANDEILYYTCGMHPSVKSDKPGSCPICNMALVPVYREELKAKRGEQLRSTDPRIKYWTCGMHPSVKSDKPGSCPICNMALVPVYEEKAQEAKGEVYYGCGMPDGTCPYCDQNKSGTTCICGAHTFTIKDVKVDCPICGAPLRKLTPQEAAKLKGVVSRVKIKKEQSALAGVQTQSVRRLHLFKEIRTVGKVAYDPDLAIAQEEFLSALKSQEKLQESLIEEIRQRADSLLQSSRRKLKLLGMNDRQIKELEENRQIQSSLILPEEKMWIYGDVYEYEVSWVREGGKALVTTQSYPGQDFIGEVVSVNPVVDPKKRTLRFRAQVDNPGLRLKPEMYVDVIIQSMYMGPDKQHEVLAIPKEAVLDTGRRKIVWLDKGEGSYEGRIINIGPEATSLIEEEKIKFYPVLSGLEEGELVVTKANFLIDSQSQLSGVAASAYGGALGVEEGITAPEAPTHQMH